MSQPSQPSAILRHFAFEHLTSAGLKEVSKLFHDLAHEIEQRLPSGAEKATAFRKLLEAKDAAVRAQIEAEVPAPASSTQSTTNSYAQTVSAPVPAASTPPPSETQPAPLPPGVPG